MSAEPLDGEITMKQSKADRVWNRAALENGGMEPREGDRALAALLLAHGLVMNGGVEHAIEALDPDQLGAALAGFRFFSFDEVASFLDQSTRNIPDEDAADDMYAEMIPSDSVLVNRFEEFLKASPEVFAPL